MSLWSFLSFGVLDIVVSFIFDSVLGLGRGPCCCLFCFWFSCYMSILNDTLSRRYLRLLMSQNVD